MGAVIFYVGPSAALYCIQLQGLVPTSGAKCVQTQLQLPS